MPSEPQQKKEKGDKKDKNEKKDHKDNKDKKNKKRNLQERSQVWKAIRPFLLGAMAGCTATTCIQPIDMVKVRIQLQGEGSHAAVNSNPFSVGRQIVAKEGILSLYKGFSAAMVRQCTYGTTRLGIFNAMTDYYTPKGGKASDIAFTTKLYISIVAGGVGALVGTPADTALVRMQSDAILPPNERRGYKNIADALIRMAREEGVKGFFSGASPTVARGLTINIGQLTTYDYFKAMMEPYLGDTQANRFVCAILSGWVASTVSLPCDFIKTRMQKQRPDADGKLPYRGFFDAFVKVAKKEGPLAFYRGYTTYLVRIIPHITITWLTMDNLKILFGKMDI